MALLGKAPFGRGLDTGQPAPRCRPMPATTGTSLSGLDWTVLGIYLLVLVGTGFAVSRQPRDSRDYFVGHGHMPSWAVALSVLASALSVATFLGAPAEAFAGNLTYLISNLGTILAVLVVAWVFIPVFYRHRVVTVYELIAVRFGAPASVAVSVTFLAGRSLASGVRLYFAAMPVALILGAGDDATFLIAAIAGMALVATVYALVGGIASIIWTDVVQFLVMIAAVVAALVILWLGLPADGATAWQALSTAGADGGSKLTVIDWSLDWTKENTVFTALTGYLLFNCAAYGTDQDLAQRMLTCRNAVAGGRSALFAILLNLPVVILFMALGLLLHLHYHPELLGGAPLTAVPEAKFAFLDFILHGMPSGLAGLMLAGIFAITLTSLLSAINAMASSFITDCYRRAVHDRADEHYLKASRWAVVGSGAAVAAMAVLCLFWHRSSGLNLLGFAFNVVVLTSAGILGVFLTAIFTRRGSWPFAIAALASAFVVTLALQPNIVSHWGPEGWERVAWPWRMVVGTLMSFAVCCLGRRAESAS